LNCYSNKLTNLPELPSSLQKLFYSNNPFCSKLEYKLTIETMARYNEELKNSEMIDYVLK
jgi:hypothetical protein